MCRTLKVVCIISESDEIYSNVASCTTETGQDLMFMLCPNTDLDTSVQVSHHSVEERKEVLGIAPRDFSSRQVLLM